MKTRREFLRSTVLGASAAWTVPMFVERTFGQLHDASKDLAIQGVTGKDDTILVVLQLAGGNDGLNTLVPYADDTYQKLRPRLGEEGKGHHQAQRLRRPQLLDALPRLAVQGRQSRHRPGRRLSESEPLALRLHLDLGNRRHQQPLAPPAGSAVTSTTPAPAPIPRWASVSTRPSPRASAR